MGEEKYFCIGMNLVRVEQLRDESLASSDRL
jgi:hypothetical protein